MPIQLRESIIDRTNLPRCDDQLRARIQLLAAGDQLMIEAVLLNCQSATTVARLMRLSDRSVRYRLQMLAKRMASRTFLIVARGLNYLPRRDAELARLRFCAGVSVQQLCARTGLSEFQLRQRLDVLLAQCEALGRGPTAGRWNTPRPPKQGQRRPRPAKGKINRKSSRASSAPLPQRDELGGRDELEHFAGQERFEPGRPWQDDVEPRGAEMAIGAQDAPCQPWPPGA